MRTDIERTSATCVMTRHSTSSKGYNDFRSYEASYTGYESKTVRKDDIRKTPSPRPVFVKPLPYWAYGSTLQTFRGSFTGSCISPPDSFGTVFNRDVEVTGTMSYAFPTGNRITPCSTGLLIPNASALWEEFENASIIRARNAIADRRAAFGESLAELRSGVSDLGTFLGKNTTIMKGIISRNPRQVLSAFKGTKHQPTKQQVRDVKRIVGNPYRATSQHAAESLIALEWGLKPMLEDAHLLALNIEGKLLEGSLRVNGRSASFREDSTTVPGMDLSLGQEFLASTEVTTNTRRGVSTSLWYDIDVAGLRTLTQLGLTDIPQVAWALLPFSFAVDWVIPIGTWLKSLTATFGLRYQGGTSTAFYRGSSVCVARRPRCILTGSQGPWTGSGNLQVRPEVRTAFRMERKVHNSEPVPYPPSIRDPFGAYQATMSASILASQLKVIKK